jgi:hypothetical protein
LEVSKREEDIGFYAGFVGKLLLTTSIEPARYADHLNFKNI